MRNQGQAAWHCLVVLDRLRELLDHSFAQFLDYFLYVVHEGLVRSAEVTFESHIFLQFLSHPLHVLF